jgi:hypothetical protein
VRQAGEQTAPLHLLAATVLSLVHACLASLAFKEAREPLPAALGKPLRELTSAFAALTEAGDGGGAPQAAAHADHARCLATDAAESDGWQPQLVGKLLVPCVDDTLPLTRTIASEHRDSARLLIQDAKHPT